MNKKYLNIYSILSNKIESKEYKKNSKLPSEKELMTEYKVSRDTVRKALNLLEQNGYIQKNKGRGSFILDIDKLSFPISGVVSFKEISQKYNNKIETFLEKFNIIKADSNLSKGMEISEETKLWKIVRTRSFDGEKVILDKDYILQSVVNELTEDICKDSIYNYLENTLNLKISYAKKEITVQKMTKEDKNYLNINNFDMVVVVKSYTYLEDTTLFQYTESRHRPDKFIFVDFARRDKKY